jgi:hypothetical protein
MMITIYEDYLLEQILNEKININNIVDIKKLNNKKQMIINIINRFNKSNSLMTKKYLIYFLIILIGNFSINLKNDYKFESKIEKSVLHIMNIVKNKKLTINDVKNFKLDAISGENIIQPTLKIINTSQDGFIDAVNNVKPGRLNSTKINRYDKYDDEILIALEKLKLKGESPNPNFIKTIMLIETGMKPLKNHLGFEGFPQTKEYILNGWIDKNNNHHIGINQKYGTNFTIKDMYDAGKSAQFIHYYLKSLKESKFIKTPEDMLIAYNWGIGNLVKYKTGDIKKLPNQTIDYINMYNIMKLYYPI